ncbi:hypothetical protein [uncultured Lacinutrix sp.]|uniref:hypothetical protein n=1 Tax=uncultured Lacinutrix sp. TaxID=574032 RepID=UPI002624BE9E|nr:hypothetical protein [uncultured Lacinutrix sp.]
MRKITLLIILFAFSISGFSKGKVIEIDTDDLDKETIDVIKQDDEDLTKDVVSVKEHNDTEEVSFDIIENVPIHKNCNENLSNEELKKCMSDEINVLVSKNFNTSVVNGLGLNDGPTRINVFFTFNEEGNIENIKTRAEHLLLEKEARRVVNLIPKLKRPGLVREKPVKVAFFLPITFNVVNSKTKLSTGSTKIDRFPTHKRCDDNLDSKTLRDCTTEKIVNFIKLGVDLELADKLFPHDKSTQFQVDFIINKKGKVQDVTAKAHKREMAAEAIKVTKRLPKFIEPGYFKGKPVNTPVSILITIYF